MRKRFDRDHPSCTISVNWYCLSLAGSDRELCLENFFFLEAVCEGSGFCRILMMLTRKSEDENVFARRSVSFCHKTREVWERSKNANARAAKPPRTNLEFLPLPFFSGLSPKPLPS